MTVAQLIEALQEHDPDALVKVPLLNTVRCRQDITSVTAMSSSEITPGGPGPVEVTVYLNGPEVISVYGADGEEVMVIPSSWCTCP